MSSSSLAQVVAVDIDPLLLERARDAFAGESRVEVIARQLADADWTNGLTGGFDAVLTATAMHWFPASALAGVYAGVARLLRPGGVFANADHAPIAEPVLRAAADALHQRYLRHTFARGVENCDQWYERAYADPVDLLRRNGFERAGAVWRRGNDALIIGIRA